MNAKKGRKVQSLPLLQYYYTHIIMYKGRYHQTMYGEDNVIFTFIFHLCFINAYAKVERTCNA